MFKPVARLVGHSADVVRGRISPDSTTIATGSADKCLILWDASRGDPIQQFSDHSREITDVSYHGSGYGVFTSCMDGYIRLFDSRSGGNHPVLQLPRKPRSAETPEELTCLAAGNNPNSPVLVSGSSTGNIVFYDVRKATETISAFAHYNTICSLEMSPNDSLLVSSSLDSTMRVWSASRCDCLMTVDSGISNPAPCVYGGFTADGSGLIGLFLNSAIQRWELSDRVYCKGKLVGPARMSNSTKTFTKIPGGGIAVPSEDGTVHFLSLAGGVVQPATKAHADDVLSVDCVGDLLVSTGAGEDSSGVIWVRDTHTLDYKLSYHLVSPQIEGLI